MITVYNSHFFNDNSDDNNNVFIQENVINFLNNYKIYSLIHLQHL